MKNGDSIKLSLPADIRYLHLAVNFIRETAKLTGFGKKDIHKIELASEETISNVMEHAFAGERGVFDVICERTSMGIKIRIKDMEIPFDAGHLQKNGRNSKNSDSVTTKGLRLRIIKESMDKVFFNNLGIEGKEIQLIKYLPVKSIERHFDKEKLAQEKQQQEKPAVKEKVKYEVRRMLPHEAIEVSRCAYKSHGHTFFDDYIYYPERIAELNETDDMISVVAVMKDNKIMGHAALMYHYSGTPITELTYGFVDSEYRGQGCQEDICNYLFNCPRKKFLRAIYAYAVTNHVYTQRLAPRLGINDCALLLATSPETWIFKGISDVNSQKISVVLSFKHLEKPAPLTIYAPHHHLEMIKELYNNINVSENNFVVPGDTLSAVTAKKSIITTEIFSAENCAEIRVHSYGADVLPEIRIILQALCLRKIAAVQLFLNLEDPLTYFLTAEFEKMNFFFAGIFPVSSVGGDALLLQYLNNVDLNYNKIMLFTPMAKTLRDYVKKHDPNVCSDDGRRQP